MRSKHMCESGIIARCLHFVAGTIDAQSQHSTHIFVLVFGTRVAGDGDVMRIFRRTLQLGDDFVAETETIMCIKWIPIRVVCIGSNAVEPTSIKFVCKWKMQTTKTHSIDYSQRERWVQFIWDCLCQTKWKIVWEATMKRGSPAAQEPICQIKWRIIESSIQILPFRQCTILRIRIFPIAARNILTNLNWIRSSAFV